MTLGDKLQMQLAIFSKPQGLPAEMAIEAFGAGARLGTELQLAAATGVEPVNSLL